MTNFFIICLMVLPWVFLPIKGVTDQFRLPQGMFLDLTFLGMIFLFFLNGARNVYRNRYLAFFIGYVSLNIFFNFFIPFGIEREVSGQAVRQFNYWLIEPMLHFLLGAFATYIALSYFENDDYKRIAKAVSWSAFLISAWAILQYLGLDPLGKIAVYRCANKVSACLDNPNLVGNYLALSVPFFFIFFKDRKYVFMFLSVLGGLFVSKSHFAQGVGLFSILLYVVLRFKNKKILIAILSIVLISSILAVKADYLKLHSRMSKRLDCWKYSSEKVKINPLFGQSLGMFKTYEFKTYNDPKDPNSAYTIWFNTHSDWLQYSIELGLIGIFLLFLTVLNSIRSYSFKNDFGLSYFVSFAGFLVMMIASFPVEIPALALLGLVSFWGVERL